MPPKKACDTDGSVASEPEAESERDEVQEVRKVAQKDTWNVQLWRFAMTGSLLMTAVAITLTTYSFLKQDQYRAFETAFGRFSRTLADSAVGQQKDIRDSYRTFCDAMSTHALAANATWPFVTIKQFESYSRNAIIQSRAEVFTIFMVISNENREPWITYANDHFQEMTAQSFPVGANLSHLPLESYHPYISAVTPNGFVPQEERDYYAVSWHYSPPLKHYGLVNWDVRSVPNYDAIVKAIFALRNETLITGVRSFAAISPDEHDQMHSKLPIGVAEHPHSFVFSPVYELPDDYNSPIVAIIGGPVAWDVSLRNLLPEGVLGIHTVIKNDCNQSYTYEINGNEAMFLGEADLHDSVYDDMEVVVDLSLYTHPNFVTTQGHCQYSMHIYPSSTFEASYESYVPKVFATVVASTFVLVAVVFFIYDLFVHRRNEKLVEKTAQSNAIVSSLFPSNFRDRLLEQNTHTTADAEGKQRRDKHQKKNDFVSKTDGEHGSEFFNGTTASETFSTPRDKPLADLFLDVTVMFADISGFTAWSSVREPSQVFTLLETVFQSFDKISKGRRGVLKVETVGDCYVAATGIPKPDKHHSIIMVKFAWLILQRMQTLTKELEVTLGPDTGDLSLRIGIHSGPVTAGVLRGERSRFQLFGDTMNTASRIEATGSAGRIHVSKETADRLVNSSKGHWLEKRAETVQAKGKGDIQTYFIGSGFDRRDRQSDYSHGRKRESDRTKRESTLYEARVRRTGLSERSLRLVDWNVTMLMSILKHIIARRIAKQDCTGCPTLTAGPVVVPSQQQQHQNMLSSANQSITIKRNDLNLFKSVPLDEVQEIIHLPDFDSSVAKRQQDPESIVIPATVESQLRTYVTSIASMYRDNAFHSFEHASHVAMSVLKLLSRIVAPTELELTGANNSSTIECHPGELHGGDVANAAATLHDHTYGITSDPLTQFACAFSALIHDADHTGAPNAQLIKEGSELASLYANRSVAEQNSLVLAWELLMDERFDDFRSCLCADDAELLRFRQLVVNSVMATDIVDKDLKALRNARWEAAFRDEAEAELESAQQHDRRRRDVVGRKATIVIEHLIQASDVSHTMQHWHVYRQWNERFFRECYAAYKAGRAETHPADNWYKGEIGFFDFYIIPLAKKLKNCGVFGKSSDEYLNYAMSNRQEWEIRGQEMVQEFMEFIRRGEAMIEKTS